MTYSRAKAQGRRSVGSEDRVRKNGRTNERTDGGDCITCRINAVRKNTMPHIGLDVDNENEVSDWRSQTADCHHRRMTERYLSAKVFCHDVFHPDYSRYITHSQFCGFLLWQL